MRPPYPTTAAYPTTARLASTLAYQTLGIDLGRTGYGVGVAVIDSGIGGDLGVQVLESFDFTMSPTAVLAVEPHDDYGHGTHVAGLIADQGYYANGQFGGLAVNARLISLKVLDGTGAGRTSDVIRAIEFAVQNRAIYGIDIINLSLGHPIFEPADTDPLVLAVTRATDAGIVVVASAGNYGTDPATGAIGYAGISSPGNAPSAITVGAFDTHGTATRLDDTVADFSSRGPTWYDGFSKPDIVAPGRRVVAASAQEGWLYAYLLASSPSQLVAPEQLGPRPPCPYPNGCPGGSLYTRLSGTSMAAATTTAVVARMIEANRQLVRPMATTWAPSALSPNQVKMILEFTAFTMSGYDELTQGAGALNAAGAEQVARSVDPRVPAGQPWLVSAITPSTTIGTDSLAWGQRVVWGDRLIWGDAIILNNEPAFAQRVVWGDRLVWGDRIAWGDSTVWDYHLVWSNRIVWGESALSQTSGDRLVWGDLAAILGLPSTAHCSVHFTIERP